MLTDALGAILALLAACTAAAPYDDCGPALAAARANPDARLVVEGVEAVFADPTLYARVRDNDDRFFDTKGVR